jgi:hypothetical protein
VQRIKNIQHTPWNSVCGKYGARLGLTVHREGYSSITNRVFRVLEPRSTDCFTFARKNLIAACGHTFETLSAGYAALVTSFECYIRSIVQLLILTR